MSPSAIPTILQPAIRPNLAGKVTVALEPDVSQSSEEWYVDFNHSPLSLSLHLPWPSRNMNTCYLTDDGCQHNSKRTENRPIVTFLTVYRR